MACSRLHHARCRVSIVNDQGNVLMDKFVRQKERVTDYRTRWSGIHAQDITGPQAEPFAVVQKEAADLFKDRIVVGHALQNDLKVTGFCYATQAIKGQKQGEGRGVEDIYQAHLSSLENVFWKCCLVVYLRSYRKDYAALLGDNAVLLIPSCKHISHPCKFAFTIGYRVWSKDDVIRHAGSVAQPSLEADQGHSQVPPSHEGQSAGSQAQA